MGLRDRLATTLHRGGALELALRARAAVRLPVLSVLTYHHVTDGAADYPFDDGVADAGPAQFRRQLELLRRTCTPVGLDQVEAAMDGAALPPNAVLVTFDDGYRSNLTHAAPILAELGIPAVFFLATDFITDRRLYWWEAIAYIVKHAPSRQIELHYPARMPLWLDDAAVSKLTKIVKDTRALDIERFVDELAFAAELPWTRELERTLCDRLIMTWDDVRALRDLGMELGSHTRSHRVLQTVPDAELAHELAGSREVLEAELGEPIRAIAYPVGRPIHDEPRLPAAVAAAGYTLGFTNATGVNLLSSRRPVDRFDLRRVATDRDLSDAMFLAQVAVPPLAYRARNRVVR
ncbi:MAG: polysaccharide deacetylase family protein [Kofleriaceae bacterium]